MIGIDSHIKLVSVCQDRQKNPIPSPLRPWIVLNGAG
jgi:hypothetical protein